MSVPHTPKPRFRGRLAVLVAVASIGLVACDEKLSDVTGPSPNLAPTFSSIRDEIFLSSDDAGRTACINCHAPGGISVGFINFRADDLYTRLVNGGSRQKVGAVLVVPGDPDNSYLVQKLEGRSGIIGLRMPFNGPPYLTDGQILVIRRWIQTGAPNN